MLLTPRSAAPAADRMKKRKAAFRGDPPARFLCIGAQQWCILLLMMASFYESAEIDSVKLKN